MLGFSGHNNLKLDLLYVDQTEGADHAEKFKLIKLRFSIIYHTVAYNWATYTITRSIGSLSKP